MLVFPSSTCNLHNHNLASPPKMSSLVALPPRPNEVPSLAARRARMEVDFAKYGPYSEEMMAATRAEAVRTVCSFLRRYRKTRVSQVYFEYLVDLTIWDNWSICMYCSSISNKLI